MCTRPDVNFFTSKWGEEGDVLSRVWIFLLFTLSIQLPIWKAKLYLSGLACSWCILVFQNRLLVLWFMTPLSLGCPLLYTQRGADCKTFAAQQLRVLFKYSWDFTNPAVLFVSGVGFGAIVHPELRCSGRWGSHPMYSLSWGVNKAQETWYQPECPGINSTALRGFLRYIWKDGLTDLQFLSWR